MYIKQVVIQGFKSYKEQVAIEPFSPKHNVIVGANGSGKTNFFHAIRFVLSDFSQHLRAEERQRMLHDGARDSVLSAFVEIVFDNADNRLPIDKEEVRLRRSIGLKKDEYHLDGKHITKPEVLNLLESAGFSRSNPYYVVQQGKIQALTTMKDAERLELLKEIGGTKVYDERRKESLKILKETESRQAQIEETVKYIDERLAEVNEEREELVKYQELDKKRRSLEYTIYEKELVDTRQKLEEVEMARSSASEKSARVHEEMVKAHSRQKELEKELKSTEKSMDKVHKEHQAVATQKRGAVKRKAEIELDMREMEEKLASDGSAQADRQVEMGQLEAEIQKTNQQLAQLTPAYEEKTAQEREIQSTMEDCEARLASLYKKQGRNAQYKSKEERDAAVSKEIKERATLLASKQKQIARMEADLQALNSSIMDQSSEVGDAEDTIAAKEAAAAESRARWDQLKARRDELQNSRNALWKKEEEIEGGLERHTSEVRKKEKRLEGAVAREINRGLLTVKRICADHRITGVHGPLIELFECEEKFHTAVEVTAGNSLFNIVVDTDEIASRIIKYLNQEKGGRVSFLPLNQLSAKETEYPQTTEAVPLIKRLEFHASYKRAFNQIFGKTMLCRSLDVATAISKSSNLDCITLEGDQVNKRGALTGGYHDTRQSRLALMKGIKETNEAMAALREELRAAKADNQKVDQDVSKILGEMEKEDATAKHLKQEVETVKQEKREAAQKQAAERAAAAHKEKLLESARASLGKVQQQIADLNAELASDLLGTLSPADRQELEALNPRLEQLKAAKVEAQKARVAAETAKRKLEALLENNLMRRKTELEAEGSSEDLQQRREQLQQRREDLRAAEANLIQVTERAKELNEQILMWKHKIQEVKARQEEVRTLEEAEQRSLSEESKQMEALLGRRHALLAKREDQQRKIRDLGSLPSDAFDKFKAKALKDLNRLLTRTYEDLKKFSHVNKKALDQFMSFTEQREQLNIRHKEVTKSKEKIQELIEGLDMKKDEDIERTFKGVAKNFKEIFSDIVTNGKGEMVMIRASLAADAKGKGKKAKDAMEVDGEEGDEDEDEDEDEAGAAQGKDAQEKYSGVQVRVSFGSGEVKTMKQLSGGQKAVVALTLIFAIQRVDPAPFYLFDEIDAALDAQYRAGVGNMIHRQASENHTQFVTTTFRPELVRVCNKVYGVSHKNRVSAVDVITKDDALEFIEDFR